MSRKISERAATHPGPTRILVDPERLEVQVEAEQSRRLEAVCARRRIRKSEAVREALGMWLDSNDDKRESDMGEVEEMNEHLTGRPLGSVAWGTLPLSTPDV